MGYLRRLAGEIEEFEASREAGLLKETSVVLLYACVLPIVLDDHGELFFRLSQLAFMTMSQRTRRNGCSKMVQTFPEHLVSESVLLGSAHVKESSQPLGRVWQHCCSCWYSLFIYLFIFLIGVLQW